MPVEELACSATRDHAQVIASLKHHGCTVLVEPETTASGQRTMRVYLPEDEYQEKRCRAIIAEWRIVAATTPS